MEKTAIIAAIAAAYKAAEQIQFTDKEFEKYEKLSTIWSRVLGTIEGVFGVNICLHCGQEITGKFCSCDTEAEMRHRVQQEHDREMMDDWKREYQDSRGVIQEYAEHGVSEKDFF